VLAEKQTNQFFGVFDTEKGIRRMETFAAEMKKARVTRACGQPMNLLEGNFREAA
jgi:hypothetical protein